MNSIVKAKQLLLAVGDAFLLYLSLAATLALRYDEPFSPAVLQPHFGPFTYIFIIWLLVFYITGLYDLRYLKNNREFLRKIGLASLVNALIAILIFYAIPLTIAPKTNLFILIVIAGFFGYLWRLFYNRILSSQTPATNLLLIGDRDTTKEIADHLKKNPQLGYAVKTWLKKGLADEEIDHLSEIILSDKIDLIVIPAHIKRDSRAARTIYRNLALGIETIDMASFCETIFGKVPVAELEEVWFLDHLINRHKVYELIKQPLEIIFALILTIILLPLLIIIALLIKLTSAGPASHQQKRVGQYGAEFVLHKFRTMIADAEKSGPQWSKPRDKRVTAIGRILRASHLDELPQLFNIIKGNLSFVGPRPERPEFTQKLSLAVPHYDLRHLIRPGITGWAQINYRYGASVADAYEKLQYDIYYLKNRSFWLDIGIILKTFKLFFTSAS